LFALVIEDGLQLPNGFVAPGAKPLIVYALVPDAWCQGKHASDAEEWPEGVLLTQPGYLAICRALYGENFTSGNEDGSRYVIRSVDARAHHPRWPWTGGTASSHQYHYFDATRGMRVEAVSEGELLARFAATAAP
jgi:hypothetical protein